MLQNFLTAEIFHILLVFCRVGSAIMLMPGIGEPAISPRIRLGLAFAISIVIAYPLMPELPPAPGSPAALLLLLGSEIMIGIFFGTLLKIIMAALHTAGMIVATQANLASAMLFDPSQSSQSSPYGIFLGLMATTIMFAMDLHHLIFQALMDSYSLFHAGDIPLMGDMAEQVIHITAESFRIALQLTAPTIVVAILLNLGASVLGRLMPAMQVFYIMMPVQITAVTAIFMMTLPAVLMWYMGYFKEVVDGFIR